MFQYAPLTAIERRKFVIQYRFYREILFSLAPPPMKVSHCRLVHREVRGQPQVIVPPQPIVAVVGDDIILPCHLEPAMDAAAMTLEWARPDLDPRFVHVRRDGRELVSYKNPSYEGRTSLFIDKLKHGDISLKLSKVKLSDEGRYRCFIPSLERDSIVQLVVGAVSSPVIEITKASSGVVLGCESKGWYPEPEVFWLDGEGNILSAGPTETVRGPDGLYTVSSRVTVEKTDTNRFTCRVQQQNINQTRETHIHVPDDFFPSSSAVYIIVGLAVVFMCIVAVVFVVWRWRRNKIKTKKNHEDETEQRGEKKTESINNGTELQVLMKREGERDREPLTAEGEEMRDVKKKRAKWQTQVIGSPQPIVALAGDDVILPCQLEPASAVTRTVEWTRPDLNPQYIHVHQNGQLIFHVQNPLYKYRTVLFLDELRNGNVSLKLFRVKLSDEGKYRCFIPSIRSEATIQLTVGAVSSPVIEINKNSSEVDLGCESKGWYPEPEVFWLDGEGNILSAGPTETVRGPDGLYTVSSRVTVEKTDTNRFTCRVQQQNINQTRETQIHVPGKNVF
ncbi:butyrophilin-like protein 2 [Centroberyx gerrardi]